MTINIICHCNGTIKIINKTTDIEKYILDNIRS